MHKTLFLKYIFIPLWFSFLTLPFMGIKNALFLGVAIFAGKTIFLGLARFKTLTNIKEKLKPFFKKRLPAAGMAALKDRNIIFINIAILLLLIILPLFL